jgi:hypothetical protein
VKRLISIALASMMLLGNMGFVVGTHYCGGVAVESRIGIGHTDLDCGMEAMNKDCAVPFEANFKNIDCCDNEYQSVEIQDDYKPTLITSTANFEFIAAFISTFTSISYFSIEEDVQYTSYLPPPLEVDVPVLHQVFLL